MLKIYYTEIGEFIHFCRRECKTSCEEAGICEAATLANPECLLDALLKKVNEQRRSKILRCKNEKDKQRSLMAGLLLRFALEQEGVDYEKAEFSYGEYGKPFLRNSLFFSLTHCERYVACAISDKNIGIDIEETDRKLFLPEKEKQLISMAKRICTQTEYTYFSNLPKKKRVQAYLEIWTRKESLAKADGRGLAIGFEQIEVLEAEGFETRWITESVCMSVYSENMQKSECRQLYVTYKELL